MSFLGARNSIALGIQGVISAGTNVGSTVPGAPTIGTATATGTTTATVSFTQPASNGGSAITSYTATSSPGGITGTLSQAGSGTITVTGLTSGTAYTFTVTATNAAGTSAASAASNSITTSYAIAKSLRFRSSASAYLNRTPATTTNQKTWTWSAWVKRGILGSSTQELFIGTSSGNFTGVRILADQLYVQDYLNGSYNIFWATTAVYRDPAAWYHVVVSYDTTQASSANAVSIWINGALQTAPFQTALGGYVQNRNGYINTASTAHYVSNGAFPNYYDGEMAEINFVDGQALAPTAFGASSIYNQWLPKKYAGTYGTNGFYLPFTNTTSTSTLVADSSGNANNWTPNNISLTAGSTYDSLTDVPTLTSTTAANYVVWNPLWQGRTNSPTNGNLDYPASSVGIGTMDLSSNSFYWEITSTGGTSTVAVYSTSASSSIGVTTGLTYGFRFNGSTGAFDYTTNGTTFTSIATGLTSGPYFIYVSTAAATTASLNAGQRSLAYTAPSGFLPLNTFNIAAGTVTTSGTFTGNLSTDGPFVFLNGTPTAMTINGNAVTFGTHADKLANGFKVRSSSALYNLIGSNTYVATTVGEVFKYEDAQSNP